MRYNSGTNGKWQFRHSPQVFLIILPGYDRQQNESCTNQDCDGCKRGADKAWNRNRFVIEKPEWMQNAPDEKHCTNGMKPARSCTLHLDDCHQEQCQRHVFNEVAMLPYSQRKLLVIRIIDGNARLPANHDHPEFHSDLKSTGLLPVV